MIPDVLFSARDFEVVFWKLLWRRERWETQRSRERGFQQRRHPGTEDFRRDLGQRKKGWARKDGVAERGRVHRRLEKQLATGQ